MIRRIITLFTLTVFVWLVWSFSGRNTPLEEPESHMSVVQEINPSDSLTRNIVGIQPYMEVSDYFNQVIFKQKIRKYLVAATGNSFIQKNTIIVYPEHIGTWLFLLEEKHNLAEKNTLNEATRIIAVSNAFDFFLGYIKTGDETNKEISSIIRMKAKSMARAYSETFQDLAIETKTYILAGSILLPEPKVVDGEIIVKLGGPLYNASFLFGPDGKVVGSPILKTHLSSTEEEFTSPGAQENMQVFDLPFGKTCIIPFNDSCHPQSFEKTNAESAEIILSTSFFAGNQSMYSKWIGYDGKNGPDNIDSEDVGILSNKEAWEKYCLPQGIKNTQANVGFNVFFKGDFWDLNPSGQPIVVLNDQVLSVIPAGKGGIWSLNF